MHWNKLEWVNPKSLSKGKNPIQFLQKRFYLNINDRTAHWFVHSKLKELDINDLLKRKQMNEEMETYLIEMDSKNDHLAVTEEVNVDQAIPIDLRKE